LFFFPKGFRFNSESKDVLAMSRKYAAEYDLPQFQHVLIPRTKVTYAALTCLKDKIQSIYDVCIVYTNSNRSNQTVYLNNTSLMSLLNLDSPEIHIHVNRIPIEHFIHLDNVNEEDVGNWLINAFEKKDKLLNMIHLNNYDLLSTGHLVNLSLKETLPSFLFLSLTTLTLFSTKFGRKLYCSIFLYGTVFSFLSMKFLKK
jgi:hypothetical protein